MRIAVVVGNPKPASRTLRVALAAADALSTVVDETSDRLVVDLAEYGADLLDWQSERSARLCAQVAASDLIVVASPTYKATYTGLLKIFFDRYGNRALEGRVAVPVMTGASLVHALAPETHLRPLLVELGAATPTRALYVTESDMGDLAPVLGPWGLSALPEIARFFRG
ncbi:MAG TPA: NAD(P)H-dependent oxidoreductase [Acidimicrobiales bacterium]|jgi:FMN reductase|nr:NAD(P)H-dependent oxidoreductase [Acidimicrobiales bacterium]